MSDERVQQIGRSRDFGPTVRRRRRRLLVVWAALCGLGALPSVFSASAQWQAAGWGLWLPGAGFASLGGWWLMAFIVALGLFVVSVAMWLFTGNAVAPVVTWLGLAGLAGLCAGDVLPASAPYIVVGLTCVFAVARLGAVVVQERRRETLGRARDAESAQARSEALAVAVDAPPRSDRELTTTDLAALRGLLDLALQPVGELAGFDTIDPRFQPAALRYQLNKIQYALAVAQCQYTPNFHGYLSTAQRFTIESLTLPQVCGYWMLESLWGNLRWNPDPVATKDNVMLTGWSGHCLGTYAANTGDQRYGNDGALDFRPFKRSPNRRFPHSHHDFLTSLRTNWAGSPYGIYPCEPNFTYSICNMYAYGAAVGYDRAYGTTHADDIRASFTNGLLNEFRRADGELQPVISDWTGLTLIFKPTLVSAASTIILLNTLDPALAQQSWSTLRHERLSVGNDGRIEMGRLTPQDRLDVGNYRPGSAAFTLASVASAAHEMGDSAIAHAAIAEIDATHDRVASTDVVAYQGVSVLVSADIALARILRRDFWRNTVVTGPGRQAMAGPLLSDCAYPDVMVAKAISTDGLDLHLVLQPGSKPGTLQRLRITRLRANGAYRVVGPHDDRITANGDGEADVTVRLNGRCELTIVPDERH